MYRDVVTQAPALTRRRRRCWACAAGVVVGSYVYVTMVTMSMGGM